MKELKREKVSIIGFPMDLGAGRRGVDMGPSALRIAGLQPKLEKLGYDVNDTGDIKIEIMENVDAQSFSMEMKERYQGLQLWKYALALSLIFLLIETLFLRFL